MVTETQITLMVSITAKEEYRAVVKAQLTDLARRTRLESGNVFYVLHESTNQPNLFIIYERWAHQEALDTHMSQGYLQTFLGDSKEWLSDEIKGIFCQEVPSIH